MKAVKLLNYILHIIILYMLPNSEEACRRIVTFFIIAPYKYPYLLTYLLNKLLTYLRAYIHEDRTYN